MAKDFKQRSVNVHQFAMVPRADVPRSAFRIQKTYKTTFDGGRLYPIYVDEVLPGDTFNLQMTAFARMATPIFPIMDNLYLESFFFFVPCRLVWDNWKRFMGERDPTPTSSIDYVVPTVPTPTNGWTVGSIGDYMGLPTVGQVNAGDGGNININVLPLRAYNLIYNEWFRDENLQGSATVNKDDGPDSSASYVLRRRGKRHDYFTSCLPWTQKGDSVMLPLGDSATIRAQSTALLSGAQEPIRFSAADGTTSLGAGVRIATGAATGSNVAGAQMAGDNSGGTAVPIYPSNLYADLSTATAATINQIRQAFQIQRLLERDARGGTRYTELVRSHFGVMSPDARLQRPEYLGGGRQTVDVSAVAQTSATDLTGGSTPIGELAAFATSLGRHGFSTSFVEHGYVIGLVSVRADLTYQQGLRKMWSRSTRYDFYFPVFAHLGEQAVLSKEIFCDGTSGDENVFGYQERWAEYRYNPSQLTGLFRSTSAGTLDVWHLAQRFSSRPTLNTTFIQDTPPIDRVVAVGEDANGAQFLLDAFFDIKAARPMPLYSVPGLVDHF